MDLINIPGIPRAANSERRFTMREAAQLILSSPARTSWTSTVLRRLRPNADPRYFSEVITALATAGILAADMETPQAQYEGAPYLRTKLHPRAVLELRTDAAPPTSPPPDPKSKVRRTRREVLGPVTHELVKRVMYTHTNTRWSAQKLHDLDPCATEQHVKDALAYLNDNGHIDYVGKSAGKQNCYRRTATSR